MNRLALFAVLSFATGCGGGIDPEAEVTIDQGVYGLATSGCDTSPCRDSAIDGAEVTATPSGGGPALSTTSDGDGFFELALPAGTYELCIFNCTSITIGDGERLRRDFLAGPGGGLWCQDGTCRPE
jgi:hypothetical protein